MKRTMVKIKICGFTRRQDIEDAAGLGIKIIGINFFPPSPRHVKVREAKKLLDGLPDDVLKVGVFVNPDEKFLFETSKILKLDGIQLHGNEPPWLVKKVREKFAPEKFVIKAVRVRDKKSLEKMRIYKPDYFLLDSYEEALFGGTGEKIDYGFLDNISLPWEKIFLAGGITPGNIREILGRFKPHGIDVASGVEMAPGIKDREKIKLLIKNTRETNDNAA
ncbi:MAG TPA: phosphoribosylanthranilate isomerase [bacterium]|nr:phosphoribosylanthranilate isomerase [bacterium]